MKHTMRAAMMLVMAIALCRDASAQALGTIAGSAKDNSGAFLPGFTASIEAGMRLGNIQETVTVTGESPMVDLQSAAQRRAVTDTQFKELPSGVVDSDGRTHVRRARIEPGRRRRPRRSDRCPGQRPRQPRRRRRSRQDDERRL